MSAISNEHFSSLKKWAFTNNVKFVDREEYLAAKYLVKTSFSFALSKDRDRNLWT